MDVGEKNNLGVLLTSRSSTDYKNQVVAVDGKYYFTKKDVFSYQLMHSSSNNPDCVSFECDEENNRVLDENGETTQILAPRQSDNAYTLRYRHNEENYSLRASYNDFGKDFRADMGFVRKVDYKKIILGGNYTWFGDEGSKWTRWGFFGDWSFILIFEDPCSLI